MYIPTNIRKDLKIIIHTFNLMTPLNEGETGQKGCIGNKGDLGSPGINGFPGTSIKQHIY